MLHVTPNTRPSLFRICLQILSLKQTRPKFFFAGDWNTTLHSIDKHGGRPWHETNYRNLLFNFMNVLGLDDAYRLLHLKKKAFTYKSKSLKIKSRIDFFLIAQSLKLNIRKAETAPQLLQIIKPFS